MNRKFLNKSKPKKEDIWYVPVNGEMVPKEGYQEVFDKEGVFVGKGNYKNGVRNGFWQFYHPNGKLSNCGYYGDEGEEQTIRKALNNLHPVCSNCHRVIHKRAREPYKLEDVKKFFNDNNP